MRQINNHISNSVNYLLAECDGFFRSVTELHDSLVVGQQIPPSHLSAGRSVNKLWMGGDVF